jgi:hypothetical protein
LFAPTIPTRLFGNRKKGPANSLRRPLETDPSQCPLLAESCPSICWNIDVLNDRYW